MLGIAWLDEVACFGSPPSRPRMALDSQTKWSEEDPSSKKVPRWMQEERQDSSFEQTVWVDELHCTWTDELWSVSGVDGSRDDYTEDDETARLVEKFLQGSRVVEDGSGDGGGDDWSRNSLHAIARFRTAAPEPPIRRSRPGP